MFVIVQIIAGNEDKEITGIIGPFETAEEAMTYPDPELGYPDEIWELKRPKPQTT